MSWKSPLLFMPKQFAFSREKTSFLRNVLTKVQLNTEHLLRNQCLQAQSCVTAWVFSEWDALPQQKAFLESPTSSFVLALQGNSPSWWAGLGNSARCRLFLRDFFFRIINWLISLCSLAAGKMSSVSSGLGLENETSFSLSKLMRSCIISFSTALQNSTNTSQEQ